jgi:hypothetical protein
VYLRRRVDRGDVMSRSQSLNLLVRLGAACQRSCSGGLVGSSAATSGLSCLLGSQASTSAASWHPWGWGHDHAAWQAPALLHSHQSRSLTTSDTGDSMPPRPSAPNYFVSLGNLRDNPGATRQVGATRVRGDPRLKLAGLDHVRARWLGAVMVWWFSLLGALLVGARLGTCLCNRHGGERARSPDVALSQAQPDGMQTLPDNTHGPVRWFCRCAAAKRPGRALTWHPCSPALTRLRC